MTTARTMTDREINESTRFYPHHEARDDADITGYPCIEIEGNPNDGDGAVQVYVYAEDGVLHVSLDFDNAGPGPDGGPWAYYGPHHAVPVIVTGGDGQPVYEALPGSRRRQPRDDGQVVSGCTVGGSVIQVRGPRETL